MTEPSLKPKQQAILDYIRQHTIDQGYPPSVREIGSALGLSSSSTVHGYLRQLEELGYLHRDPSKPRAMVLTQDVEKASPEPINNANNQITMLESGGISAVRDQLAGYQAKQTVSWSDYIPDNNNYGFVMPDDSMLQIGIYPGNLLLIKDVQLKDISDGDILLVRDQAQALTVRSYYKGLNYVRLQPEQNGYEPVYIKISEFVFIGKVVANLRFYK